MNATTGYDQETDMNAVAKIAAIPTVNENIDPNSPVLAGMETIIAPVLTPKQAAFAGAGAFMILFMMAFMLPDMNLTPSSGAPATVSTPAASSAATPAAAAPAPTPHPHKRITSTRTGGISFPQELTPHHLYDQDYSLTWKDMGAGYTYRVYYANDKQMHDAAVAFFKPVDGTLYRFTINGDAKNVWMAVAPIDGSGHEGILSRPVNMGEAQLQKS